jgi:hypothetical protein
MTSLHPVRDDFPREPVPGLVPGAQPRLLVRKMDKRYRIGLTDEELWARYQARGDAAHQLAEYASRKMSSSGLSLNDAPGRVEKVRKRRSVPASGDFYPAEITWMTKHTCELLLAATSGGGVHHDR